MVGNARKQSKWKLFSKFLTSQKNYFDVLEQSKRDENC